MDVCSEKLIKTFLSGTVIPSMTLIQYQTSAAGPYAAATVTLTNAYVASWSVGGAASYLPSEAVSFLFSKMCVATISLNATGQMQVRQEVCYDAV
jgi:type VI protein secretion system component Hcp